MNDITFHIMVFNGYVSDIYSVGKTGSLGLRRKVIGRCRSLRMLLVIPLGIVINW